MLKSKLYSKGVLVLGAVQLVESIAFALPMSYFPNYVIGLGASVASLGLFISSFMVSSAIMSPRLGALSDREGRKKMMIFGLIGDVIFGTLTGLVPSWH
ncbi:MAG: MFS transporter, partial [Candidatus Bathyarchaeota archaeon]|nr:MFS transporter [Candidatus Bathyarchaeota archaeon]